jgi:hypothetical protein
MNEFFKKTNEFLSQYEENLQMEYGQRPFIDDGGDAIDDKLWNEVSHYYVLGGEFEYHELIKEELKELNDKGIYFHYCEFKTYEKTYKDRLNEFLKTYVDADTIYFLEDELKKYSKPINYEKHFKKLDQKNQKRLSYTRDRTVRFLVEQGKKIGYNIIVTPDKIEGTLSYEMGEIKDVNHFIKNSDLSVQWKGNQSELIELTKALIENGNLKGNQEDIFEAIQENFNFKLNNIDQAITKFNWRNQENETKFLDTLKVSLSKYIKTKLDKKR